MLDSWHYIMFVYLTLLAKGDTPEGDIISTIKSSQGEGIMEGCY